ncbi:MAG TPA: CPBP family intramembrane glutamic endopeptidase [Candidatus Acidoferrales bacterium]|nr:CPBP family intramembrane glutamic endopeptidase [Candidatus Acidoferrales bacterium]
MSPDPAHSDISTTSPGPSPAPPTPSAVHKVFMGPDGIRSGTRILMVLLFFLAIARIAQRVVLENQFILQHFPSLKPGPSQELTPGFGILNEGTTFLCFLFAVFLMTLIERKSFSEYGLPGRGFLGKSFWQGVPYGFALLSLLLVGIFAFHGFTLGSIALGRDQALRYGFLYAIMFLLVGFFEEFSFRGYLQATLGSGIGFWPAAIALSILFGVLHLGNSGEAVFGAVMAGTFGIVAAFSLARTGTIWFAIGMHASWDWAETYFYGVPDSGLLAKGHLFSASFHGPNWLTGGSVGPEGSYFALLVLLIGAIGIHFLFPAKKNSARAR